MTGLPDLESRFRKSARTLPSPISERFDAQPWQEAIESSGASVDDHRLHDSALWLAVKSHALYETRPDSLARLGSSGAVMLAVGVLNGQYQTLSANSREAMAEAAKSASGPLSVDYVANLRFANAHGQRMSMGDFFESFVDALDAWLFDASRYPVEGDLAERDVASLIGPLIGFYSMRHILKRLWDKALHQGHYRDSDGVWVPPDRRLAALHQAWSARDEAVFGAGPAQLVSRWADMSKTERQRWGLLRSVKEARPGQPGFDLKVSPLGYLAKRPRKQPTDRIGLENSYLAEFLELPLPNVPAVTAMMIENAWWVCADAARACANATAQRSPDELPLRHLARAVERGNLVQAVARALKVDINVADQVITFLTYPLPGTGTGASSGRGQRGLWAAPLVAVPGTDLLVMPNGVLETSAPLYRVEAWLEKGGISDEGTTKAMRGRGQRGNRFEQAYRGRLRETLGTNTLLPTSRVAAKEIAKDDRPGGFSEQIDLFFKLGKRLFVGELKFLLRPADPHQWGRYHTKLAEAAAQAQRKAAALGKRRDVAAAALDLPLEQVQDLPITPLIVLNSGFGFSLEVDGCRVVDASYLGEFMKSPNLSTGGAVQNGRLVSEEVTIVYRSEGDAARRFDTIMAQPGVLMRFLDRVKWEVIDYPSDDGMPLRIASPFRGDMTPAERLRRAELVPERAR